MKEESEKLKTDADEEKAALVSRLKEMLESGVRRNRNLVANVEMTLAFLSGNQFVKYVMEKGVVPIANSASEYRVMENIMLPAHRWRRAKMFQTRPVISALEGGHELSDVEKAYAASKLCDFWRSNTSWMESEKEAFAWMDVCGLSFMAPCWRKNPFLKKVKKQVLEYDEAGKEVDGVVNFVRATEKEHDGSDLAFDVYHMLNTYLFPLDANHWSKVTSIITADLVSRDWLESHLPKNMIPDEMEAVQDSEINYDAIRRLNDYVSAEFGSSAKFSDKDKNYILMQYREKPSWKNRDGRHVIMVGGKIAKDGPLPYISEAREIDPSDEFNISMGLVPWFSMKTPGKLIPPAPMELLRSSQIELNDLLTDEARNRKTVGRNKIIVEKGTFSKDQYTDEHGEIIEVEAGTRVTPQVIQGQPLVGIAGEIERKRRSIDETSGRTAIDRGENLPQVRSAFHLDILREAGSTIINDEIREREIVHELVAKFALAMAKKRMPKYRVIEICGEDAGGYALAFMSGDIRTDIRVQEGSALPRSHAAREAKLNEMLQYGAFQNPKTGQNDINLFWRMSEMGTLNKNYDREEKQRQRARNENYLLLMGIPVIPATFEDHAVHLEEILDFMCRPEFYSAPQKIQALFFAHSEMERDMVLSDVAPEAFMENQQPGMIEESLTGEGAPELAPEAVTNQGDMMIPFPQQDGAPPPEMSMPM